MPRPCSKPFEQMSDKEKRVFLLHNAAAIMRSDGERLERESKSKLAAATALEEARDDAG